MNLVYIFTYDYYYYSYKFDNRNDGIPNIQEQSLFQVFLIVDLSNCS